MTNIKLTLTKSCQLQDDKLVEEFGFMFYQQLVQSCGYKQLFSIHMNDTHMKQQMTIRMMNNNDTTDNNHITPDKTEVWITLYTFR